MKKIALGGKNGYGKFALVDDEDFEVVSEYKWQAFIRKYTTYARASVLDKTSGKYLTVLMHRIISKCDNGYVVDHINHDGLDNRRDNLRICSRRENNRNKRTAKMSATGEYLIYPKATGRGYYVSYSTQNKKCISKYFMDINNAIKFRNKILKKHYDFKSNLGAR